MTTKTKAVSKKPQLGCQVKLRPVSMSMTLLVFSTAESNLTSLCAPLPAKTTTSTSIVPHNDSLLFMTCVVVWSFRSPTRTRSTSLVWVRRVTISFGEKRMASLRLWTATATCLPGLASRASCSTSNMIKWRGPAKIWTTILCIDRTPMILPTRKTFTI